MLIQLLYPNISCKMNVWLFIFYLTYSLGFINNKVEAVNKKLPKSFDEIFGNGWDEKEGEMDSDQLEEMLKNQNGSEQQNDDFKEDKSMATQNDSVDDNQTGSCDQSVGGDIDQNDNDQKREIVRNFYAIKEKVKQKGIKFTNKEHNKIDCAIAKKLGTNRTKIYKLIQKFGIGKQKMEEKQKREIIRKFNELKKKVKQIGRKFSSKEWLKIERRIAKELGANREYIYKWTKELGMKCREIIKDKSTKIEIIQKFVTMTNEYKQKRKHSAKEWREKYAKISKKFGIHYITIQRWMRKFGMGRKIYTDEEKFEIMRQYWEIKRSDPKISDRKIAKILNIHRNSIRKLKREEFEKKF